MSGCKRAIKFIRMNMNVHKKAIVVLAFLLTGLGILRAAEELGWPREITQKKMTATFYQPQLESYIDNMLEGRMAISLQEKGGNLVFGAVWFKTTVFTDKEERTVTFQDLKFEAVKFPEMEASDQKRLEDFILKEIKGWYPVMSLDRFLVSLEDVEGYGESASDYEHTPPEIIYRQQPAVLVYIDGEPMMNKVEGEELEYVLNTPYFIVKDQRSNKYYLNGGRWWYASKNIVSEWEPIDNPPNKVLELSEQAKQYEDDAVDSAAMALDAPPEIIVRTRPAELIVSDGEPQYASVNETDLLYMKNTESDVIMDINSQNYYVLISGRWFTASKLNASDWRPVAPENLPEDFAQIPTSSDIAGVRSSVPNTMESKEAILENSVPQTAEIDRKSATVEVKYDGNPKFEKVTGTSVAYAANSDKTVLLIDGTYYCVDDAVWFESAKATGPWEVSVEIPDDVQDLPASCPVYNVKYVHVYHYTPSVVYVGYTPGYYGSYVYHGTVIYGTGYYYRPWYHHYYYPRPVTYGFGVHYNPYTGWGFSVGVSYGWIHFGYRPYYRGYWGPAGYRYGYRHGYHRGYHHGYRHGYRHGYQAGRRAGYAAGHRSGQRHASTNVYRNRSTGVRSTSRPSTRHSTTRSRVSTRDNNVSTDRSGNVYRRDNQGNTQRRDRGNWNNYESRPSTGDRNTTTRPSQPSTRESRPSTSNRPSTRESRPSTTQPSTRQSHPSTGSRSYNPNSTYQQRQRGTQRSNSYQRSQPQRSSSPSRSSSGRSGGSRRR